MVEKKQEIGIGKLKTAPTVLEVTKPFTELTIDELKVLVNLLGQATTTVLKAQLFINLINKMSKMIDEQIKLNINNKKKA